MDGFISVISINGNKLEPLKIKWKKNYDFQSETQIRSLSEEYFYVEQKVQSRMIEEKFWLDTDDYLFITDGVILNIDKIKERERAKSTGELISILSNKSDTFFDEFRGGFVGFFYNKKSKSWRVFNNHAGTKKLFYFRNKDYLLYSTDLYVLCNTLILLNINYTLDKLAAYVMLTSGFMMDNITLISEVRQLRAGEYLKFDTKLQLYSYYNLQQIKTNTDSKSDILYKLECKFKDAIQLEFDKDLQYGYGHLCTLSGGLDSRMTTLVAYKMGYDKLMLFNFSEKDYADEIIAKEIAEFYELKMMNKPISPYSLTDIDDVVRVNDGLTIYTGASHVFESIKNQNYPAGCIHTGMIGDAVLGSFVTDIKGKKASLKEGLYASNIRFAHVERFITNLIEEYPNEELYKFYNRAFMGANNGYLYLDLIGETTSPFLDADFLSYAYSIPLKYKYKERIYIDWIRSYHPDIAQFVWESIGGKPTNNAMFRLYYRYKRALVKRMPFNSMWKNNMNPEQIWYDQNEDVRIYLDTYFYENIDRIIDSKLRNDVIELYRENNIEEKAKCITLVAAIKLLFL